MADKNKTFPTDLNQINLLQASPGVVDFGGVLPGSSAPSTNSGYDLPSVDFDDLDSPQFHYFPGGGPLDPNLRGLIIPDDSLRRQTMLAIVVTGEVCPDGAAMYAEPDWSAQMTGRIEVGQVLRVTSTGRDPSETGDDKADPHWLAGGRINAHILAVGRDNYLWYNHQNATENNSTGFRAIESVRAARLVRGSVKAIGRQADDSHWAPASPMTPRVVSGSPAPVWEYPQDNPTTADELWINRGSVVEVVVGPEGDTTAEDTVWGIVGNVWAKRARITQVLCEGPIGVGGATGMSIEAGDSVRAVRVHRWSGLTDAAKTPIEKDISTTIRANLAVQKIGTVGDGLTYAQTIAAAREQGAVNIVETAGAYSGTIYCTNLIDAGTAGFRDSRGRAGLITWDNLAHRALRGENVPSGPSIFVDHLAHNVSVLAPDFQTVSIGWQFKGALVAYGSRGLEVVRPDSGPDVYPVNNGTIYSLSIGQDALLDSGQKPTPERYTGMVPGFVGGWRPPVSLDPTDPQNIDETDAPGFYADSPSTPYLYDNDRWLFVTPPNALTEQSQDGGAVDSVIRAERLIQTKVAVFGMHQRVFDARAGGDEGRVIARYRPRIECPSFLGIEFPGPSDASSGCRFYNMAGIFEGVVWSGKLRYAPGGGGVLKSDHPTVRENYSSVSHLRVQRMGPGGDLWQLQDAIGISSDMCGEIHCAELEGRALRDSHVIIGDRLGNRGTSDWPFPWYNNNRGGTSNDPSAELSPRGRAIIGPAPSGGQLEREQDSAPRGAVYVGLHSHETGSSAYQNVTRLEGSVIVNKNFAPERTWDDGALNNEGAAWHGFVRVGDPWADPSRVITLGPSTTTGVTPAPTTQDLARKYQRRSWELSGVAERVENRVGGAVGVVPYSLHLEDSSPPLNNAAFPDEPHSYQLLTVDQWVDRWPPRAEFGTADPVYGAPGLAAVRLRFYGPINEENDTLNHMPVKMWRGVRLGGGSYSWTELSQAEATGTFDYRIDGFDLYIGPRCGKQIDTQAYKVTRQTQEDGADTWLWCSDWQHTLGVMPEESFTWYFRIWTTCADIGQAGGLEGPDDSIDNNDFIVFINWFFVEDERADVGQAGGLDGADGLFDNNDFVAFINRLFNGQSGCVHYYRPEDCGPDDPLDPEGGNRQAGRASGPGTDGGPAATIRAVLEQMIADESDTNRREQLQQMLNSLPTEP